MGNGLIRRTHHAAGTFAWAIAFLVMNLVCAAVYTVRYHKLQSIRRAKSSGRGGRGGGVGVPPLVRAAID